MTETPVDYPDLTSAEILADSVSPTGVRITTFELTFQRFILAELNTHRDLSRNSASSRAIPPEKQIEKARTKPFVPTFGSRVKGMGEGELDEEAQRNAKLRWLWACSDAIRNAEALLEIGIDKSRINRLLEPFMWHTAIVTATEWSNFYSLRRDSAAQGEFRHLADLMYAAHIASMPEQLHPGEWHLPLVTAEEKGEYTTDACVIASASRCARVSYDRQHDDETMGGTVKRYQGLRNGPHLSPCEHPATPITTPQFPQRRNVDGIKTEYWRDNLFGWESHRFQIPFQYDAGIAAASSVV